MERPYLVKLVRDRAAHLLPRSTVEYAVIPDDGDAVGLLRMKLVEEAVEYVLNPSVAELGDVLDVAHALAHHDLGVSMVTVNMARDDKDRQRGGFDELTGMYVTTTAEAE